ncbi:YrhK family protein [Planctobacterium marinum]|uniref:YrhK family protein n=1 Tax=Planctobacterium marinum TaxID=1631968 RepID=UPI001E2DC980|nr:YrhK family protein [Planctobacterium marinum]MCC2605901.1 YrhK family protein [Planctobacterium marinum]
MLENLKRNKVSAIASISFFIGSTLFLPFFGDLAIIGIWLFMTGSALMFWDSVK